MLRNYWSYSAAAGKAYFDQELRPGDYYSEGQEVAGQWGGVGAAMLGLEGTVERQAFHDLVDNIHPVSGERLTARTNANRRVYNDMNFHYPKGVSVVEGITGDTRIREAFLAAADATMGEMEAEVRARVRKRGQNHDRVTGNLIWARFDHRTSRPVDGMADPQGHSHYIVFNATYDAGEERWKAVQIADLIRDKGYWEARFEARFAGALGDLGYRITRDGKGYWDVDLPVSIKETFSKRKHQIEQAAQALGVVTTEARHTLARKLRSSKTQGKPMAELRRQWDGQLSEFERAAIWHACHQADGEAAPPFITSRQALDYALAHSLERASVVRRRKLEEQALRRGVGSVLPEAIAEETSQRTQNGVLLSSATADGQEQVTTPEVLAEEAEMVAYARAGRGTAPTLMPQGGITWQDPLFNDPEKDTAEQKHAITSILNATDQVILLRGGAGTGKTTLMRELAHQIRQGGRQIHAFAPTAAAARDVLRTEGFAGAETVARLLVDGKRQQQTGGGVIWIDEAGLLGTRDLHRIFNIAHRQQARVILTGDDRQHHAVARGDGLRTVAAYGGVPVHEVQQVQRQKKVPAYRQAVEAISRGEAEKGFAQLDALGWVQEYDTPETRHQALARDYAAHQQEGRSVLVISPTHAEADAITGAIRNHLGRSGTGQAVTRLVDLNWTDAQKGDAAHYAPDQVVQFTQNVKGGFTRGSRYTVTASDSQTVTVEGTDGERRSLPLAMGRRFAVYQAGSMRIAEGDLIRITRNGITADRHRLNNGTVYRVREMTPEGNIRLDNDWVLPRDHGHIAYGYVQTSHSAQGRTRDVVLIAQGAESFAASNREQFYVSVSRGRQRATLYTNDKDMLASVIAASDQRMSALDLARAAGWQEIRQRRSRHAAILRRYLYTPGAGREERRKHGPIPERHQNVRPHR